MEPTNDLSPKTQALLHRLASWSSPSFEDFEDIKPIEQVWEQLLFMLLTHCPDNWERQQALTRLEEAKFWARNSIIRKSDQNLK
ncbi:MAG: hypothetical protein Fur006_25390 [Coleofasciculaceae cyanobacterium]|jgi:hypothetical protein